jgi:hypothetical protein
MSKKALVQLRARDIELQRLDPAFVRVLMTSDALGKGEYLATFDGKPTERQFTYTLGSDGPIVIVTPTPLWQNAPVHETQVHTPDLPSLQAYAPPDPYAKDIAAMRAAEATPESTFEEKWKADRLRDLAGEDDRLATLRAARGIPEPRLAVLSAADLAAYATPDPYAAGIKALQAKEAK